MPLDLCYLARKLQCCPSISMCLLNALTHMCHGRRGSNKTSSLLLPPPAQVEVLGSLRPSGLVQSSSSPLNICRHCPSLCFPNILEKKSMQVTLLLRRCPSCQGPCGSGHQPQNSPSSCPFPPQRGLKSTKTDIIQDRLACR